MKHKNILEKQVEALEKLLQLKQAIIEEQEAKINRLEMDKNQPQAPFYPYFSQFTHKSPVDLCSNGMPHSYPSVWHGTVPPSCAVYGKMSTSAIGGSLSGVSLLATNNETLIDDSNNSVVAITSAIKK